MSWYEQGNRIHRSLSVTGLGNLKTCQSALHVSYPASSNDKYPLICGKNRQPNRLEYRASRKKDQHEGE